MYDAASAAADGFEGFVAWRSFEPSDVPADPGVYLVLRNEHAATFRRPGSGGFFKGRDPNVDPNDLLARWIDDTDVVYIGKATSLRARLRQFRDFGHGRPVGHWGGRYIWQVDRANELVVCWRGSTSPASEESDLLRRFEAAHGTLPFANLRR